MKKVIQFLVVVLSCLSFSLTAFAEEPAPTPVVKPIDINLSISPKNAKVGDTITLTARTTKKTSSFSDKWSGATHVKTIKSGGKYVSTAKLKVEKPGEIEVAYLILQKNSAGAAIYQGAAKQKIKVAGPEPKEIKIEFIPTNRSMSLDKDGQAVLIVKIPRKYADQGFGASWSDHVTNLDGPVPFDNDYSYMVGLFQPEETGKHKITFEVYHADDWVGYTEMELVVLE